MECLGVCFHLHPTQATIFIHFLESSRRIRKEKLNLETIHAMRMFSVTHPRRCTVTYQPHRPTKQSPVARHPWLPCRIWRACPLTTVCSCFPTCYSSKNRMHCGVVVSAPPYYLLTVGSRLSNFHFVRQHAAESCGKEASQPGIASVHTSVFNRVKVKLRQACLDSCTTRVAGTRLGASIDS